MDNIYNILQKTIKWFALWHCIITLYIRYTELNQKEEREGHTNFTRKLTHVCKR